MTPAQANLIRATALSILAPGSGIYRDGVREALAVVDAETARALNAPKSDMGIPVTEQNQGVVGEPKIHPSDEDPSHIQLSPLADDNWGWVVWYGSGDENKLDADGIAPSLADALAQVAEVVGAPRSPAPVDSIVAEVRADLLARSEVGIVKYGVTLDRRDLGHAQWLQHGYEEALDLACYLKRAMRDVTDDAAHAGHPLSAGDLAALAALQADLERKQAARAEAMGVRSPPRAPVEPPHAATPFLATLTPEPEEAVLGRAGEALAEPRSDLASRAWQGAIGKLVPETPSGEALAGVEALPEFVLAKPNTTTWHPYGGDAYPLTTDGVQRIFPTKEAALRWEALKAHSGESLGSLPVYVLAGTGRHPYGDDAWHLETDGVARLFPSKEAAQRWLAAMGRTVAVSAPDSRGYWACDCGRECRVKDGPDRLPDCRAVWTATP